MQGRVEDFSLNESQTKGLVGIKEIIYTSTVTLTYSSELLLVIKNLVRNFTKEK